MARKSYNKNNSRVKNVEDIEIACCKNVADN